MSTDRWAEIEAAVLRALCGRNIGEVVRDVVAEDVPERDARAAIRGMIEKGMLALDPQMRITRTDAKYSSDPWEQSR